MQLTPALYRNSILFFAAFALLVLWGFWQSFFSNPLQVAGSVQLHGVTMTLWCVLLLMQAFLIKTQRRELHRFVGRSSYVLAPIIVVSQVAILRSMLLYTDAMSTPEGVLPLGMLFAQGGLGMTALFAVAYAMAILNRRDPAVHARWMVCTTFAILAPATDRITRLYLPALLDYFPTYPGLGLPVEPTGAFVVSDVAVAALALWDWRSHRRLNVFPVMLALLLLFQTFHFNAHRIPLWEAACNWFLGLPAG